MGQASKAAIELDLGRQIDRIGYLDLLWTQVGDPLRENVKRLLRAGTEQAGQFYKGSKFGGVSTKTDPEAFVKLWETGKITRAQFIECIAVKVEESRKLLCSDDFAKISDTKPGTPRLVVRSIEKITPQLADAMEEVALAVREKAEHSAMSLGLPSVAGYYDIAARYLRGGAMRLLHIGDSISFNAGRAMQMFLRPALWSGFIGGIDVSTEDVNFGDRTRPYIGPGAWAEGGDGTYTWTNNGNAAESDEASGVLACLIHRMRMEKAATMVKSYRGGDWMRTAKTAGYTPSVSSLVQGITGGFDNQFYLQVAADNAPGDRYPSSGGITASGSGWTNHTLNLTTALAAAPTIAHHAGWRLANGVTATNGGKLKLFNGYLWYSGRPGFVYGNLAVAGSTTATWGSADGYYPDALLTALCSSWGVTDFMIMLGANGGFAVSYEGQLETLIARLRAFAPGCGIILVATYELESGKFQDESTSRVYPLAEIARDVALADGNALFLNVYDHFGPQELNYAQLSASIELIDAAGLGDGVHLSTNAGKRGFAEIHHMLLELAAAKQGAAKGFSGFGLM